MTDRAPYVMFGHSRVLGDLIQLIDLCGGVLTKIVENVPEQPRANSPDLATRLARFHDPEWNPEGVNQGHQVERVPLEEFEARPGDKHLIGFTGHKMDSLVRQVSERHGVDFEPLVHPAALVTPTARLGSGCIVMAGAILESGVTVGSHTYVNKHVVVGHDTVVAEYCFLGPGSTIGGHAVIGAGAYLGMGARILEDRRVGDRAVVAAGAVVTEAVPARAMVAGVPAVVKRSAT